MAFGFGCEYFSQYEEQGVGIQWYNTHSSPVEGDSYSFTVSIVMLYVDAFIYAVSAWYIEAVFPGEKMHSISSVAKSKVDCEWIYFTSKWNMIVASEVNKGTHCFIR